MSHPRIAVAAVAILLATTACGGSPDTAAATDQLQQSDRTLQESGPGRGFPGATGKVAAIDGRTLQVQNAMEGQVAVTYTGSTEFSEQVEVDETALEVGDCVMVTGEGEDTLAATAVRIIAGDDGCSIGRPEGGAPEMPGDGPPPGAAPEDLPDGAGMVMMAGAFGEVTAVTSGGFTVETAGLEGEEASTRQISTSADTTWTDTVAATSSAVKVGRCVTAQGERDDTGAVTARTITVSDAVDGECVMGGGFRMEARG